MAQNSLIQVRVDEALKKEADQLINDPCLDASTAIRIFLSKPSNSMACLLKSINIYAALKP